MGAQDLAGFPGLDAFQGVAPFVEQGANLAVGQADQEVVPHLHGALVHQHGEQDPAAGLLLGFDHDAARRDRRPRP